MKKFMIFLLMAFLYIGTCQARSESSHPNDAQLKLLSWVSPTPDQSFMTRDIAVQKEGMVDLKVDADANGVSGSPMDVFDLELSPSADAFTEWMSGLGSQNPQALYAAMHVEWFVENGDPTDIEASTQLLHWHFSTSNLGVYTIYAVVSFTGVNDTYISNSVTVTIEEENPDDPGVELEPEYCENLQFLDETGAPVTSLTAPAGSTIHLTLSTTEDQVEQLLADWPYWQTNIEDNYIDTDGDLELEYMIPEETVPGDYSISIDLCLQSVDITVTAPEEPAQCSLSDVTIENTATGESWTIMEQGNQSAPEIIVTTDDVANLNVTMSGNPSGLYSVSYEDASSTFGGEGLLSLMLFPNGLEAGDYLISFDALNANYVPCEVGGEFEITVVENAPPQPEDVCDYAWIQDQGATEKELTTTFETGSTINWEFLVSHNGWVEGGVTWFLDDVSSTPIGYDNELDYTLPSTISLGQHTIIAYYTAYDNETFYIYSYGEEPTNNPDDGYSKYCPKNILINVTEGVEPFDPCQTVPVLDGTGNPVTEVTLHAGDGPVTLSIGYEAIEISGWTTDYPEGLEEDYDVATLPGPTATTTPGDYTVTVNFEIFGVFSQLDGGTYIELAEPVECHNTVILHVLGSEGPTPTPTPEENMAYVTIKGNTNVCPNDEVTLFAEVTPDNLSNLKSIIWTRGENIIRDENGVMAVGPYFTFVPSELFGEDEDRTITAEIAWGVCGHESDTKEINYLLDAPEIHINVSSDVCVGGQVTATIEVNDDNWTDLDLNNPIYNWYVNGVEVPGEHMGEITLNMPMAGEFVFAATINTPVCSTFVQSEQDTVHVYEAMPLTITGDNVVCQNASATMTATDYTNATYAWAGPDPAAETTTGNELTTTIPGVYAVTATMDGGCYGTAEFTVYQFGGDLQVTADQMNVCPGTPVILNANLDGWFNENIEYEWSDGLGTSSTVSPTVDATTTYYVTASVTDVEGHDGDCQLTSSITIKVIAGDTVNTVVYNYYHADSICLGQQLGYFTAQSTVSDETVDGLSYVWYIDGIEVPGENLNEIEPNFNELGLHYISAKAVVSGCAIAPVSDEVNIHVIGIPEITISGNNVICAGNTATLNAVANTNHFGNWGDPNNYSYNYKWSDGTNGSELTTTEAGVYTVTATTVNTDCFATASIEVTTFGGDLQITASEIHVCPGTPVMLNANLDGWNNENITYEWSDGSTTSTITPTVDATTTYTVTASTENAEACQLISSITIQAAANDTIITDAPTADQQTVCVGDQIVLEVEDASYEYIWYKNGVEIPGQNQPSITVTPTHSGIYTFAAKAIVPECYTSLVSDPVSVTVMAAPDVHITGTNTTVVNGATSAHLTASVLPAGDYTYNWSTGATGVNAISVNEAGVYNVTVTDANGCKAISAPFQVNPVSPYDVVLIAPRKICYTDESLDVPSRIEGENLSPNLRYRWLANGQYIEGQTGPTFSLSPQALYNIIQVTDFYLCLEISDLDNCDNLHVQCSDEPISITGQIVPDHIVVLNDGTEADYVCEGAELNLTVYVKNEDGEIFEDPNLDYVWTRNGVVIPGVHGSSFTEQAWIYDSDPVTYTYAAYIDFGNGCISEPIDATSINVRRNPIVTIDGNPNVCYEGVNDMNVTLVAWVDGYYDPTATYKWYESGQALDNDAGMMNYYVGHFDPNYLNPLIFTVEVTNGNGCSTIAEPFYVNVYDRPIVNISGDANAVCTNGSVTLRANLNNYNDTMLVFQWYENEYNSANLIPGATHEVEIFYPTEATTYVVAVKHLMDYNNPDCIGVDSFRVNINGIPQVTVENDLDTPENPNVTEICEGRSIKFTAHTRGGIEGEAIYTWYRNGELVENVTGDIYVDAPLSVDGYPTTYIYSVIVNQGFSGCESELTFFDTITVNPNPAIQLVSDPIICSEDGNNVILTANMDVVPTGVQYRWLEDNEEMAVTTEPTYALHKDFSENPYHFSVQIVNTYGCTGQSDVDVYVNDAPVVVITATDSVICEDGQVTLTAALQDWNSTELTYQWYDGDAAIEEATSLSYTVTPALGEEHHYHIVISQTSSGCVAGSNTIDVEVVAKPAITSITEVNMPEDRMVCDGYQVNMTANVEGGVEGGEVFTWYRNGVEIEGATQATLTEVVSALNGETTTYTYTVAVAQATSGCVSEIYDGLAEITVNPNPVLQLVTNPIVCNDEGDNITLTANLNPEMEGATFKWFEDNVEMDPATYTANGNSITLHKDYRYQPYSFSVELVSELGCTSVGEALVYVNEAPVVNIFASDTVLCDGGVITLTASLNDWNADELVYQWFDGEEPIDGATSLSVDIAPAAGVHHYHVHILQQSSGCEAESNVIDVVVNGAPVIESVGTPQTSICYGGQLTITAAPEGGDLEGDTYTWYRNGILMEGATAATIYDTPEIIDNNTQQYVYTAILTRPAPGCTSDAVTSDVVTVYPNPVVVITGDQHVCETDSVFLIANVDTVGMNVGGLHYTWYESGQIRDNMAYNLGDNSFFAEYMYARTEPYRFTVDVWRDDMGAGCISHSEEYLVYVYTQPVVNITASETEICENGQVTLTANLNDYNATDLIYQWYTVGQDTTLVAVDYAEDGGFIYETVYTPVYTNIPGATLPTYTTNLTETTNIGVMVRQTPSNCWATDVITINVNPIPVVTDIVVDFLYDTVTVCNGAEVTIAATVDAYDIEGAVFTWFRNGVELEGVNGPIFSENVYTDNENVTTYHYSAIVTLPASGCVSEMSADAGVVIVGNSPASVIVSGNTVICNGGSTTLYANVVPDQPATYEWFKDNVSINTQTDYLVVTEAGSYKVVASFGECSTESDAVVVTVEETPQLEVTAVETTFCAGGSTIITAEATGWNNGNVNYNWDNGYQGSAYTFNPESAGTYTFYVTASQATSGCVAVDSIVINVNELPETPVVAVDNAVVCDGGQVTLMVTNPNVDAVYTWYRNGSLIAGATNAILTESPVTVDGDLTNYVYTVVSELPMSGCTSLVSANMIVTVIPTPVVAVSVEGNTTLCAGGSTILHANVTPAGDIYHYQWYKDNVLLEGDTLADYVVSEEARETAYNFSVVVSANPGCNVTAYAPAITFVAQPVVEATISNNFSCEGGTATLNVLVNGGVPNPNGMNVYTFQWYRTYTADPSDMFSITEPVANTPEFVTSANDAVGYYSYWVTFADEYGCETTSAPVNYTVIPDPVIVISRLADLPASVCDGGSTAIRADVLVDAFAAERGAVVSYQWYKNGNILVGETNQILNINALAYGVDDVYSVEVIQTGVGCSNTGTAAISTLVTVYPAYTVNITGFGNVCEGGTLTLNAEVIGHVEGDELTYQWFKIVNGYPTAINGATSSQYSTSDFLLGNSYDYYVVVTSTLSGCSVVSTSVPANVVEAPTVVIQGANTVCEGGNLILNAFVSGGVEGAAYTYTWEWTGGGVAPGSATTTVPTFVPDVPANDAAAPYYFTVTISRDDNTGCTATSVAHEVNILPAPSVTVTADNSYVCQNGEVTFTAHVSPVGSYNYLWTINDQQEAVNANTITTSISNVGTINAVVLVSTANASSSCSTTASIAVPVQVVAVPTVTVSADHTTMCVGGTSTFTSIINANANIPANFNYQWAINGIDVPGAVSSTFVHSFNAAAEYEVSLRVSQNNNIGCNATSTTPVTVQVAEQPVVTLNSEDGLSICEGGSITMTGIVTNYNNSVNGVSNRNVYGALTFNWTSNGVSVPNGTTVVTNNDRNQITQTLNNVGNYSYQVTVDAAGYNCQPQASNIHVVNVVGDPSWTEVHVYSSNGTDACLGDMVTLLADIQGGVVDANNSTSGHIQWVVTDASGNTTNVSGGLGGSSYDIPAVAGSYIYTPTFVGNIGNGCQLTNTADVQVAVTVHELPTATFTSGDGASICANDPSASAALVISFTGVAPFTYEVVDGQGNVVAHATTQANTATIYVAPTEQTTYRLTLIQDAYCENTSFDATAMATVYVNSIEFDNNIFESGCDNPGFVTINFNMISGNPTAAFTVVYENGLQASGNISNNTATFAAPTEPGDYNAVFTVDGCSYDIVVRVLVGDFSFGGTLPIMDQRWNDVVVVNNNPSTNGGHLFVSFQWYKNGVAIPGAVYSNYQEKGGLNGFYSVELIEQDANGNMVTYKTCDMYFSSTSTVKVYPVPANVRQEITIELDLTSEELEGAVLDIYSVTGSHVGHVIDLQPITKIEGFKAQGTYFGRILTGTNEIKTVKFVIVK